MPSLAVTGVGGALGTRCLEAFSDGASFDRVIGIDRRPPATSAPRLHFEQGELTLVDLEALFAGVDTVLHLAGNDPRALRRVLEAAEGASVGQVVVLSSAAALGAWRSNPVPLPDDAPLRPNPEFSYAVTMAEIERMVSEWSSRHPDVAVAVLRMAMIVGVSGGTSWINALGGLGLHQRFGGDRPVQFLHVEDAVSAIRFAVDNRLDGVYNVSPDNFIGDSTAKAVAGAQPRPPLPRRVVDVVNRSLWRRTADVDYSAVVAYLEHPWVISSDRLRKAGWKSSYSSQEALVAVETPTWWGSLRPGQRRTLLGLAAGAATLLTTAVTTTAAVFALRRRRP